MIRFLSLVIANIVIAAFLLLVFEGTMSWAAFFRAFVKEGVVAENRHTKYDPIIGWVNRPGAVIKDVYGPGKNMTILDDGTRLTSRTRDAKPGLICSGDSLTLGYGVDDLDAWCAGLTSFGWHTVNMGQGGYGLDQSYLWYKIGAAKIQHDVHLAAFFTGGLYRASLTDFIGYGKPILKVVDGKLVETNIPAPRPNELKRFALIHEKSMMKLATVRLFRTFGKKAGRDAVFLGSEEAPLVVAITTAMADLTRERGARFIAVMLPTLEDYYDHTNYENMRSFVEAVGKEKGFEVIDVGSSLFDIKKSDIDAYFIAEGAVPYFGAAGHYSEKGNAFVAQVVGQALDAICAANETGKHVCQ